MIKLSGSNIGLFFKLEFVNAKYVIFKFFWTVTVQFFRDRERKKK